MRKTPSEAAEARRTNKAGPQSDKVSPGDLSANFSFRPFLSSIPSANPEFVVEVSFKQSDWAGLQNALGCDLSPTLRERLQSAVSDFFFALAFADWLPPQGAYDAQLCELVDRSEHLLRSAMESFATVDLDFKRRPPVMTAEEHWVYIANTLWKNHFHSIQQFLNDIEGFKNTLNPSRNKDKKSQYQIRPLMENLVLIAKASGTSLSINSRGEMPSASDGRIHKMEEKALLAFAKTFFEILKVVAPPTLNRYEITSTKREVALALCGAILDKNDRSIGRLLDEAKVSLRGRRWSPE